MAEKTPETEESEDVKSKFREALDRKQHQQHGSVPGAKSDGSNKSHGATEPTQGRIFRRKSG